MFDATWRSHCEQAKSRRLVGCGVVQLDKRKGDAGDEFRALAEVATRLALAEVEAVETRLAPDSNTVPDAFASTGIGGEIVSPVKFRTRFLPIFLSPLSDEPIALRRTSGGDRLRECDVLASSATFL